MTAWSLHHGDCLSRKTGLPTLADQSVDVTITDPPYSPSVEARARSLRARGWDGCAEARTFHYDGLTPEVRASVAQEIGRLTRRWALVFCDVEGLTAWIDDLQACGMRYVRCGAWIRQGGAPQITGDRPAVGFEAIGIFHRIGGRMRWNGHGIRAVWTDPIVNSQARIRIGAHTTPKPIGLMESLVRLFSDQDELVLDPFAGSATTGVAAVRLGRRFVGWEKSSRFFRPARARLRMAKENLELFPIARRPKPKQLKIAV